MSSLWDSRSPQDDSNLPFIVLACSASSTREITAPKSMTRFQNEGTRELNVVGTFGVLPRALTQVLPFLLIAGTRAISGVVSSGHVNVKPPS